MCGTDVAGYVSEGPGLSVYALSDGTVYRTYVTTARGLEPAMAYYGLLDRTPKGRDESAPSRCGCGATTSTRQARSGPVWGVAMEDGSGCPCCPPDRGALRPGSAGILVLAPGPRLLGLRLRRPLEQKLKYGATNGSGAITV